MGAIYGDGPLYHVEAMGKGFNFGESFSGARAFSEANEYFEEMKAREDVLVIHFTRLDGGEWKWVVPPLDRRPTDEDEDYDDDELPVV